MGEYGCGKLAFRTFRKFESGDYITSDNVILPDDTKPIAGNHMVCGTCYKPFRERPKFIGENNG
jgi:hypothetical protein